MARIISNLHELAYFIVPALRKNRFMVSKKFMLGILFYGLCELRRNIYTLE